MELKTLKELNEQELNKIKQLYAVVMECKAGGDMRELKSETEHLYAKAMQCKVAGDMDGVREYGLQAIVLYQAMEVNTLEEAAAENTKIDGVLIPELMHEGVVRKNLGLPKTTGLY
ncbi:hypothetical protein J4437_03675 [Candidatus Woesearchaeota archaeon]|nr:hypothetical protein [Candidatus Woesearchaeota archaeon]